MQKTKKSNNKTIEELRMILDNPNVKDPSIEKKIYLKTLQKRLTENKKESYFNFRDKTICESDSLKANVTIHRKEETSFDELKPDFIEPEEIKIEEKKEDLFEDEELYEIEKVEYDIPEFIETQTSDIIRSEKTIEKIEDEETIEDEELPEWEPVESEEIKYKKPKKLEKIPDWEPISKVEFEEINDISSTKKPVYKEEFPDKIEHDEYIDVFRNLKNISNQEAKLLYENGITSIETLKNTQIKELAKIKGIKRGRAKKIKKEVEEKKIENEYPIEDFTIIETKIKTPKKINKGNKGFTYGEYSLYRKEIKLSSDEIRTIHFFSKDTPDDGDPVNLPDNYEVKLNKKNGIPYLRKK